MRGVTLWQPYAGLIAIGAKTIETRSWATRYRGLLLIHAAKKRGDDIRANVGRCSTVLSRERFNPPTPAHQEAGHWKMGETLGHVLAVARLVDCRPMTEAPDRLNAEFGNFGPGRFGWVLEDITPLTLPVPWRGAQGIWDVPEKLKGWVQGALPTGRWPGEEPRPDRLPG